MIPAVLDESKIFPFKFWFEGEVQDGMAYQNELFCRLLTADVSERVRLYQYACHISDNDRLALSTSESKCSLWVSLRSIEMVRKRLDDYPLPLHLKPPSNAS